MSPSRSEPSIIRLFLADDQDLIRRGLRTLLTTDPGLQVVGEAENARKALDLFPQLKPDVVLMDVRMPVMDGVAGAKAIQQQFPQIKVLMLTTFDDQDYVTQALQSGAAGYLLKDTPFEELTQVIRLVYKGYTQFGPGLVTKVLTPKPPCISEEPQLDWDRLSVREKEIVQLVAEGCNNREVAQRLNIAEKTVKNYITNILSQFNLRNRTQLAIAVLQRRTVP
jgi:DNA-binding NarL/FixJ family response regulator